MKKSIQILFFFQLLILTIICFSIYSKYRYLDFFYNPDKTNMYVSFSNYEEFEAFSSWFEQRNIKVYSLYTLTEKEIVLHMNSIALENDLVLKKGEMPQNDEFVSNVETNSPLQCGIIKSLVPEYRVKIYDLHEPENYGYSSVYAAELTDEKILFEMEKDLKEYGVIIDILESERYPVIPLLLSSFSVIQIVFSVVFLLSAPIIMIASLIQFVIQRKKDINVIKSVGLSRRIVPQLLIKLSFDKNWIIAVALLMFIVGLMTLLSKSYREFWFSFNLIFLGVLVVLGALYAVLTSVIIAVISFRNDKLYLAIKGERSYKCFQFSLSIIKGLLVFLFITTIALSMQSTNQLITEMKNKRNWESAKDIYRISMNYIGQDSDLEMEVELQKKVEKMYKILERDNNAFFMDATDIYTLEMLGEDFPLTGLVTNGWNTHITVSPNYFCYNPIYSCEDVSVENKIKYDQNILNILVPESLSSKIPELEKQFLEYFYFYRIGIFENVYSQAINDQWNPIADDNLKINIIQVKDNQSYFTFSPYIRKENGNKIIDPVVVVYTDNFHPSSTFSKASRCLYFKYDGNNDECNDYLEKILGMKGFIYADSIYSEISDRIVQARHNLIFGFLVTAFSVFGLFVLCHCLIANYVVMNRKAICTKGISGFGILQQFRQAFVLSILPTVLSILLFWSIKRLYPINIFSLASVKYLLHGTIIIILNEILAFLSIIKYEKKKIMKGFLKENSNDISL